MSCRVLLMARSVYALACAPACLFSSLFPSSSLFLSSSCSFISLSLTSGWGAQLLNKINRSLKVGKGKTGWGDAYSTEIAKFQMERKIKNKKTIQLISTFVCFLLVYYSQGMIVGCWLHWLFTCEYLMMALWIIQKGKQLCLSVSGHGRSPESDTHWLHISCPLKHSENPVWPFISACARYPGMCTHENIHMEIWMMLNARRKIFFLPNQLGSFFFLKRC